MTPDQMLLSIGRAFVYMVANTERLGHSAPTDSLVYIDPSSAPNFAIDYTRWCSQKGDWESARDRCLGVVAAAGWDADAAAVLGRLLEPKEGA